MKFGELFVLWGGMFAGKTSHLMTFLEAGGDGAICFKPIADNRSGDDVIENHDGWEFPATPISQASQMIMLVNETITHVGIDEASLFGDDPTLIPTIECLRAMGIRLMVTGLDITAEGKPFGQMPQLAAIADECIKVRATCIDCGELASLSYYIGEAEKNGDVLVGGVGEYVPLCRTCAETRRYE